MSDISKLQVVRKLEDDRSLELLGTLNREFERRINDLQRSFAERGFARSSGTCSDGVINLRQEKVEQFIEGAMVIRRDIIARDPRMAEAPEFHLLRDKLDDYIEIALRAGSKIPGAPRR